MLFFDGPIHASSAGHRLTNPHPWIVSDERSDPIPVVNVKIEHGHFLAAQGFQRVEGRHRRKTHNAETWHFVRVNASENWLPRVWRTAPAVKNT